MFYFLTAYQISPRNFARRDLCYTQNVAIEPFTFLPLRTKVQTAHSVLKPIWRTKGGNYGILYYSDFGDRKANAAECDKQFVIHHALF